MESDKTVQVRLERQIHHVRRGRVEARWLAEAELDYPEGHGVSRVSLFTIGAIVDAVAAMLLSLWMLLA